MRRAAAMSWQRIVLVSIAFGVASALSSDLIDAMLGKSTWAVNGFLVAAAVCTAPMFVVLSLGKTSEGRRQ